jgi:hypothetical protein
LIVTLVFEKTANFFVENWRTSLKIVIITSTEGVDRRGRLYESVSAPIYTQSLILVKVWSKLKGQL